MLRIHPDPEPTPIISNMFVKKINLHSVKKRINQPIALTFKGTFQCIFCTIKAKKM